MAITGRFDADFTSFQAAVEQSIVQLRGFEAGAGKVGTSLNRMVDSFSGRKIISEATLMAEAVDRVGGISKLTEKELARIGATAAEAAAKLRAWGQDVPVGIQKLADSVKNVGTAASGATSLLSGMAAQLTGMFTIGAVIAFGREVLGAGDKIQKMADQTALGTGEVQKLMFIAGQSGTSVESLVGAVQNLQQRLGDDNSGAAGAMAKLGINADAFNKLGTYQQMITLAGAIKDIHDPTEQASLAAALFGKTWKEILPAIKSGMQEVGDQAPIMADSTIKSLDRVGDALTAAKAQGLAWGGGLVLAFERAGFALGDFLSKFNPEHFGVATSTILKLQGELNDPDGLKGALASIQPPMIAVGKHAEALGMSLADADKISQSLTKTAEKAIEVNTRWADTMAELNAVGAGWKGTLDTIDGTVVEAIKYYLAAGVSQKALAEAYGLTAAQLKSVDSAMKDDKASADALAASHRDLAAAQRAAASEAEAHNAALKKQKQIAEETAAQIEKRKKANREMGGSTQYDLSTEAGRAKVPEGIATWLHDGYSLAQAAQIDFLMRWGLPINSNDPLFKTKGPRVPGFASGVQNFGGGLAMVGERGPELVNLPRGSDVVPFGRGGGSPINLNITVAGGAFDPATARTLAKVVGAELTRQLAMNRLLPS